MSMYLSDERLSEIMAEHSPVTMFAGTKNEIQVCNAGHGGGWPCNEYTLSFELVAERARIKHWKERAKVLRLELVKEQAKINSALALLDKYSSELWGWSIAQAPALDLRAALDGAEQGADQ